MANIIPCNEIEDRIDELKLLFVPCYKLKSEDIDLLSDLVYSASLCSNGSSSGSGDITNQNNVFKTLKQSSSNLSNQDPSVFINNIPLFTVDDIEILNIINEYFSFSTSTFLQLKTDYYFLKLGKGSYGIGGTQLTKNDFLLYKNDINGSVPLTQPNNPQVEFLIGDIDDPAGIANLESSYTVVDGQDLFFVVSTPQIGTLPQSKKIYRFIGAAGTYGLNETLFTNNDFILVEDLSLDDNGNVINNNDLINIIELEVGANINLTGDITNIAEAINASFGAVITTQNNTIHRFIATKEVRLTNGNIRLDTVVYDWKGNKNIINEASSVESDYSLIETIFGIELSITDGTFSDPQLISYLVSDLNDPATEFNLLDEDIIVNDNDLYVKVYLDNLTISSFNEPQQFKIYRFLAGNGTYGLNNTQVTNGDFLEIDQTNNNGLKNTSQLINDGENGNDPFITLNEVSEYLLSPINGSNQVNLLKDNVVVSTIDLTPYLDDTNLARITQGVLDAQTGIVTFTRDDSSTFTIDLSELIDIQVQSDFNVTDVNAPDFIKNKPSNLTDISIQDENGIEQFTIQDLIQIEGVDFDNASKKIVVPSPLPNTFFGGMQNDWPTKEDLAANFILCDEFGTTIGNGTYDPDFIKGYKVDGDEISCVVTRHYKVGNFFGRLGAQYPAQTMTYWYDYDGFFAVMANQMFRDNTTIKRLVLNGVKNWELFMFDNNALEYVVMNKLEKLAETLASNCYFEFPSLLNLGYAFASRTLLNPVIKESTFPDLEILENSAFLNSNVTSIELRNVKILASSSVRAPSLTHFSAPKVEEMSNFVFLGSNQLTYLSLPNLKSVYYNNASTSAFSMNSIETIHIPKCKRIGASPSVNSTAFNNINTGCRIIVNDFLKTVNNGEPDADLVYARDTRSCIIEYVSDDPKSFDDKILDVSTTYADDAAADTGGIVVGQRYIDTSGNIKVRLT